MNLHKYIRSLFMIEKLFEGIHYRERREICQKRTRKITDYENPNSR